jgi:hypothetical protein
MRPMSFMLAAAGVALTGSAAAAQVTAVEHFNNYGDELRLLADLGSQEGGWANPWGRKPGEDPIASGVARSHYIGGVHLYHNSPYYNNLPNLSDPNSGVATTSLINPLQASAETNRWFAEPLTGTIWISFLGQLPPEYERSGPTANGPDVLLWLNRRNEQNAVVQNHFIALRDLFATPETAVLRLAGTDHVAPTGSIELGETHHVLARLEINPEQPSSVSMWIDPDLSNGSTGLGTPLLSHTAPSDIFGGSLTHLGIAFAYHHSRLDSLRISNAADGFQQVTLLGAPDPLAGDANRDGQVNIADLGILAANWQSTEAYWERGDFTGDGSVTIADLGILAANWQSTGVNFEEALAMFDVFNGVVIPEPAVGLIGLLGLAGLRRRRR